MAQGSEDVDEESRGTVCVYAGVVNRPRRRRRGRDNPVVQCVPVQVWSTDQDREDVDEGILWYNV